VAEFHATRFFGRQGPSPCIRRGPVPFSDQTCMKVDELLRQTTITCAMISPERPKRLGLTGRRLLLDRNADLKGAISIVDESGRSLAQSAWTGKKIENCESGGQIRLQTNCICPVSTRSTIACQEPCDGYRRPADPFVKKQALENCSPKWRRQQVRRITAPRELH